MLLLAELIKAYTPLESPVACRGDGQFSDSLAIRLRRIKAPWELLTGFAF